MGKYRPEFQQRLRDATIHAPHAGAGAALTVHDDSRLGLFLAFVIAGHHTGLSNLSDSCHGPTPLKKLITENRSLIEDILPSTDHAIRELKVPTMPRWLDSRVGAAAKDHGMQSLAFFTRMLFSALVDADRLKTSEFYASAEGREADHSRLKYDSLDVLRDRLDASIDAKCVTAANDIPTPMNEWRASVLADCRDSSSKRAGFFSLTVPTGGGKTLSAMSFALRHATA